MDETEALRDELRDDIEVLRVVIDAALDRGADPSLLRALAVILLERQERLAALDGAT